MGVKIVKQLKKVKKAKTTISTIILTTLAFSSLTDFANGYPTLGMADTQVIVKNIENTKLIAENTKTARLLMPIKTAIPRLVVFGIKGTQIGNYQQVESNASTLFIDDSGNVLMGGQKVMLVNYKGSDLSTIDGIKKVIEESTSYKVTEYNQDGELYYFKAGSITIITNEDIAKIPYALMGSFTTASQILKLKDKVIERTESQKASEDTAETTQPSSPSDKAHGIQKALNYIEMNYPDNLVHYKADTPTTKATLTVFTDYSCPHCKDLHKQLPQLLKQGFDVNYLLMPIADITSTVAQNMQKALCAESPKEATEYLYQNQRLPHNLKERENCPVDIKDNLSFATGFSVTGTPTIIASNGNVTFGFSSVYGMLEKLNLAQN